MSVVNDVYLKVRRIQRTWKLTKFDLFILLVIRVRRRFFFSSNLRKHEQIDGGDFQTTWLFD